MSIKWCNVFGCAVKDVPFKPNYYCFDACEDCEFCENIGKDDENAEERILDKRLVFPDD